MFACLLPLPGQQAGNPDAAAVLRAFLQRLERQSEGTAGIYGISALKIE